MSADTTRGRQVAARAANAAIIACWSTHPETPTPHPGCCIPAGTEAARPVHHNEAADSLDAHAQARIDTAPDALARARADGWAEAAQWLRSANHEGGTDDRP